MAETTTSNFVASFASAQRDEPVWLADRRRLAIERFALLGLPTAKDEEYKYTSLASLNKTAWSEIDAPAPEASALSAAEYAGLEGPRAVFVDGRFCAELSDLASLPASTR